MPNWVSNNLSIDGKTKDLKRFDEQFKADHLKAVGGTMSAGKTKEEDMVKDIKKRQAIIDYRFVSKEEEKNNPNTRFPQFASNKIHYLIEMKEQTGKYSYQNFIPMTKDDFLSGFYEWNIENWGTKWDVGDIEALTDLIHTEDNPEQLAEIEYFFMSPWSPPLAVIKEMVKQYPMLTFTFSFREEGMQFAGVFQGVNGELINKAEIGETGDTDKDYKLFLNKYFGDILYVCKECDYLMTDWEYSQEYNCTKCASKNVDDYN